MSFLRGGHMAAPLGIKEESEVRMQQPAPRRTTSTAASADALRLLPGVELLGQVEGSGLREPPYYVRRSDREVVQLSRLLFVVAEHAKPGRSLKEIARRAGAELELNIRPEQVRYVLEHKLHPLGVVAGSDGSAPTLERLDPLLALKFRIGVVGPRIVEAIAKPLAALFCTPVVVGVLTSLLAFDAWLIGIHGVGPGLSHVIAQPTLILMLVGLTYASLAFHECGHAAACRRGGARPGAIGVGLYLVWPVMYTDVTDSYRLGRRGRLRTDLGGVYFNGIFALSLAIAYLLSGFEPLLLAVVGQHMIVFDQFMPWVRLDGYYVVADLIGVSDLFSRIKPVLRSLLPQRRPDARVAELKPWARAAVTTWVLTTVSMLTAMAAIVIVHAPAYVTRVWESLFAQTDAVQHAVADGDVTAIVAGSLGDLFLLLPPTGMVLIYVLLCRRLGAGLAVQRARAERADMARVVAARATGVTR
jgi:putative peptide zinc metalloprotease protein